jgi:hypothetical protein
MFDTAVRSVVLSIVGMLAIPLLVLFVLALAAIVMLPLFLGPQLFIPLLLAVVLWAVVSGRVKLPEGLVGTESRRPR